MSRFLFIYGALYLWMYDRNSIDKKGLLSVLISSSEPCKNDTYKNTRCVLPVYWKMLKCLQIETVLEALNRNQHIGTVAMKCIKNY